MLSKEAGTLTPITDTSISICRFLKLPDSVPAGILTDLYLKILTVKIWFASAMEENILLNNDQR